MTDPTTAGEVPTPGAVATHPVAISLNDRIDELADLQPGWYNGTGTAVDPAVVVAARVFVDTLVLLGAAGTPGNRVLAGPDLAEVTGIALESPVLAQHEFDVRISCGDGTVEILTTLWDDDNPNDPLERTFSDPVEAAKCVAAHAAGA